MRSLHVATAATWRGGEQQVLYLLSGLRESGHQPILAAPPNSVLAERTRGVGTRVLPFRSRGDVDLAAAWRLRRWIQELNVQVLHLHTGHAHALGVVATLALGSRPAVVVSRRVDFPIKGGIFGRWKYGSQVDCFVCVSDRIAEVLRAGGVPDDRVTTVHSGVDPERMAVPRDPQGLRRELAIPNADKLVGFVGALVGHKSPGDLLGALALLPESVHGVFAGTGPLEKELRDRARSGSLQDRVHFLGHRNDVPRLIRSVDVFCLPSRMEGLGTSVLDALAAETPVVATDGGGIPEMIRDGESGLLVPAGEAPALAGALRRVLENPDLGRHLASEGRKRVQSFSSARMVAGTVAVYKRVTVERERSR